MTKERDLQVVRFGLGQMPVIALHRAKNDLTDHPENILMYGEVYDGARY